MNTPIKRYLKGTALLSAIALANNATAADNEWSFSITPYIWVATIDVETTVPNIERPLAGTAAAPGGGTRSLESRGFETEIGAAAMLSARARYGSFGFLVDVVWLQTETEATTPGPLYSTIDLQSDYVYLTTALTYRLPLDGKFQAEVLAGARTFYMNQDLRLSADALPGTTAGEERTWVDPVIGAELRYNFTPRWSADLKGLVGGFGVSSDFLWEVFGGVSYSFVDWCSGTIGYRFIQEDYSKDDFEMDLQAHGPMVGVGFHF